MDISSEQGTGAVVFRDQVAAVITQVGGDVSDHGLVQAAFAVVSQVGFGAVAESAAGGSGILVQAVGGVEPCAVGVAGPWVAVVGPAGRLDVLDLVAGIDW